MSYNILDTVKNTQSNIYDKCGLKIKNFSLEKESLEYFAHSFSILDKKCLFRIAKKTPTKTGSFVTLWKRGSDNIIAPYDESDKIDFVVIAVAEENNIGEFIFPKDILFDKKIFSTEHQEGKRAIRVYAPWDKTTSAQASKTQKWQSEFFVKLDSTNLESTTKIKNLYSM